MRWLAKVTYRDENGKLHRTSRHYEIFYNRDGTAVELDRTRIIRDLVPPGCETVKLTREKT